MPGSDHFFAKILRKDDTGWRPRAQGGPVKCPGAHRNAHTKLYPPYRPANRMYVAANPKLRKNAIFE